MPAFRFPAIPLLSLWAASYGALSAIGAEFHEPNALDSGTLHLWHLDEPAPPFIDQAEGGLPLIGLLNGARASQPALRGLGRSISFEGHVGGTEGQSDLKGATLIPTVALDYGAGDNSPENFQYFGPGGAFTFEMVVKLDVLPRDCPNIALDLVTMEGDGEDRIFNFRIEKEGFLVFIPLPHCGSSGGGIATIPISGTNAPDTQSWFHVAVTYNGIAGDSNNLKLYWTRLRPGLVTANCIGSGSLSSDLNGTVGDFAIGNESREFSGNAEAEPFPGLIDEVRISGVARHPTDFFFVPPELRKSSENVPGEVTEAGPTPAVDLRLLDVQVDSKSMAIPAQTGGELELGSGLHRLDFDFGFLRPEQTGDLGAAAPKNPMNVRMRCQLDGIDDQWQETEIGMGLVFQTLDQNDHVVSQSRFPMVGRSDGWKSTAEDSEMSVRIEPVYIPATARKWKLILSSGSPDTTGFMALTAATLHPKWEEFSATDESAEITYTAYTSSPGGSPPGWKRGGGDPSIARIILRPNHPGIGLVDGDQSKSGEWTMIQTLPDSVLRGGTCSLSWKENYNVIGGSTHRATYVNVPPGKYTFRAIGLAGGEWRGSNEVSLGIHIHPPYWQQFWFWPMVAAGGVGVLAILIFSSHRQRLKRALERLRFQNALEKDRSRIARDMHDDLGTRVTFINMSAALATRDLERAPENALRHLNRMSESARDLIVAMEGLVWAVDPAHDTLDDLGSHLTRLAEEMFRESPVRVRLDIPPLLPAVSLGSDARHHIAMAVKESFHNILRHAGPCEVFFGLAYDGCEIRITIRDTGAGFDSNTGGEGDGLGNLSSRFNEIGGICRISSSPGAGTSIVLSCPVKSLGRN